MFYIQSMQIKQINCSSKLHRATKLFSYLVRVADQLEIGPLLPSGQSEQTLVSSSWWQQEAPTSLLPGTLCLRGSATPDECWPACASSGWPGAQSNPEHWRWGKRKDVDLEKVVHNEWAGPHEGKKYAAERVNLLYDRTMCIPCWLKVKPRLCLDKIVILGSKVLGQLHQRLSLCSSKLADGKNTILER